MKAFVIKHIGLLILAAFLVVAGFTYDTYGVTWDESTQRLIGKYNYDLVTSGDTTLFKNHYKYYGALFETPLYLIEQGLGLTTDYDIFNTRHLLAHLFFLLGAYCLFRLIDLQYNSKLLATIGFLMMLLHPRIYTHSFFNTKDVVFLSLFNICFYLGALAIRRQAIVYWLLLGVATGALMNLRVVGLVFFAGMLSLHAIYAWQSKTIFKSFGEAALYAVTALFTLYISFPFMWKQPINGFLELLQVMSRFIWNGEQLFKGEMVRAVDLPCDYIPVWFGITTPIPYLVLGALGICFLLYTVFKAPLHALRENKLTEQLFYLACLVLPVAAAIIMQSVLYGAWRHLFFIYASFVLLAVFGASRLLAYKCTKWLTIATMFGTFIFSVYTIVQLYPLSQVYFNKLVDKTPGKLGKTFEMDYWGASYRSAFEYLLANNPADTIFVSVATGPGVFNHRMLPPKHKQRLQLVPASEADFFIKQFSWRMDFPPPDSLQLQQWHMITRYGSPVVGIYTVGK